VFRFFLIQGVVGLARTMSLSFGKVEVMLVGERQEICSGRSLSHLCVAECGIWPGDLVCKEDMRCSVAS